MTVGPLTTISPVAPVATGSPDPSTTATSTPVARPTDPPRRQRGEEGHEAVNVEAGHQVQTAVGRPEAKGRADAARRRAEVRVAEGNELGGGRGAGRRQEQGDVVRPRGAPGRRLTVRAARENQD